MGLPVKGTIDVVDGTITPGCMLPTVETFSPDAVAADVAFWDEADGDWVAAELASTIA